MTEIIGYKGGSSGGSASTPTEDPDSLRSKSFARIIDLLGEGEIEGFSDHAHPQRCIYLDGTPIENSDGSKNFSGITIASRNGTQSQSYISGFPAVESEVAVGVKVTNTTPVTRTISSSIYDSLRVTISIPQLYFVDQSTGDTKGASASFMIEVQPNGGSWTTVKTDTVRGKTTTKYQRSYLIKLIGSAPWNVRVTRISDDSTTARIQNETWWESYTQITSAKLRYPNSAVVASIIDSQQFQSIPSRGYDVKLKRIRIPSNAAVRADGSLTYSGTWDGTFIIAWSANPVWVYYDMLTDTRYGLGNYITASQIDKWTLYGIGRYCDELVSDGFGGTEPRFTCNIYMQERAEAFKVLQDLASVFRGMAYWANGQLVPTQDAPSDPVALYTNANVENGVFTYQGTSLKTRHSVALVSWNDPDDLYRQKPEYVEDAAAIAKYGVVETQVVAVGCTSRGQAHRVGKWMLYAEANETETVAFKTGQDGAIVRPSNIIKVADRNRAGVRFGGRVVSATTSAITVDAPFTLTVGDTYTMSVMLPNGTLASASVTGVAGNVVSLASALSAAPQADAIWLVSSSIVAAQTFRVVAVVDGGDGGFEVTALKHDPNKYDAVENGIILDAAPISTLNNPPDAPVALTVSEQLYASNGTVRVLVTLAWLAAERAATYSVTYKVNNGNPITVDGLPSPMLELRDAQSGDYEFNVTAISITNRRSSTASISQTVYGKTAAPANVSNFSIANISNGVAHLTWALAPDLDVQMGGYVRIRHTPETASPNWSNAVDISPALAGTTTSASVPHLSGTYLARFVDSGGRMSSDAVQAQSTFTSLVSMNNVLTVTESPSFSGAKTNTVYDSALGGLKILSLSTITSDPALIDQWGDINPDAVVASGTYAFASTQDLGSVYTSQVKATLNVIAYDSSATIDSRTENMDTWSSFDGSLIDDVNAILFVRTTSDDPAGSPTWSAWRRFFVGQYTARAFQFKLAIISSNETHNLIVTGLSVAIDMPDRVQSANGVTSGAAAYSVTFPVRFKVTPAIAINPLNMDTGDYYAITSQSATGFTVTFKNAAGTTISRNFDWMAKGY